MCDVKKCARKQHRRISNMQICTATQKLFTNSVYHISTAQYVSYSFRERWYVTTFKSSMPLC